MKETFVYMHFTLVPPAADSYRPAVNTCCLQSDQVEKPSVERRERMSCGHSLCRESVGDKIILNAEIVLDIRKGLTKTQ